MNFTIAKVAMVKVRHRAFGNSAEICRVVSSDLKLDKLKEV